MNYKNFNGFWICLPGLMVDQHESLEVTNGFTDVVYLVRPTKILTINPWISKQ
jgi:hypothetical protein